MASFQINSASAKAFTDTLRKYSKLNGKSFAEIANDKGYRIAGGAIKNTKRADDERIKAELGASMESVIGKRGKALKRKRLSLGSQYWNTLAVAIVIARLRRAGKQIPSPQALIDMALKDVRNRIRSVGFIASGWITSFRRLARFSHGSVGVKLPQSFGRAKGSVVVARESSDGKTACIIRNSTGGNKNSAKALNQYGVPGLQESLREQKADMDIYIAKKMRGNASSLGIKTRS